MADQDMKIPRGFLHDGWWMASDVSVNLPSGARRDHTSHSRPLRVFLLIALFLVVAADGLFWGHEAGLSLAVFALLLGAASLLVVREELTPRTRLIAIGVLWIAILPVVEKVQVLSLLILIFGMVSFALIIGEKLTGKMLNNICAYGQFLILGPVWLCHDSARKSNRAFSEMPVVNYRDVTINWIVPIGMGFIFLGLFSEANPLISQWFAAVLDVEGPSASDLLRPLFWVGVAFIIWPFLRVRYGHWQQFAPRVEQMRIAVPSVLNATAIRNALVVFNLLFAIQTVLDLAILWGGADLPDGMTYAAYAHRGAYPLIATALLSGGFVILATSLGAVSKPVKALIYFWIAQNIVLVLSSILRLELYIEVYSLTRLRMAAVIWMALVGVGLVLIIIRVARDKNNSWLFAMNGAAAGIVLYICCFVNFAGVVAEYNIARQGGVAAIHQPWDNSYFCGLGHGAAPAKARYAANGHGLSCGAEQTINSAPITLGWRDWSFRDWRLRRELASLGATENGTASYEPDDTHRR